MVMNSQGALQDVGKSALVEAHDRSSASRFTIAASPSFTLTIGSTPHFLGLLVLCWCHWLASAKRKN